MKKYLLILASLIFIFIFNPVKVEAKKDTKNEITISFGEEDRLRLRYSKIYTFKIREDKSFYFNGVKYQFDDEYKIINNSINVSDDNKFAIGDDILTIDLDNNIIISNTFHETYSFLVEIENENNLAYTFKQEICYKYTLNDTVKEECNRDEDDYNLIDESSSLGYYYDFIPFYNENLVFEYITYKFSLVNEDETLIFSPLTFLKDEIEYKEYFTLNPYTYNNEYTYSYNGKDFVRPALYNSQLYIAVILYTSSNSIEKRNYDASFSVCLGELYDDCEVVYTTSGLTSDSSWIFEVPLTNITYDSEKGSADYKSFKLYATYKYNGDKGESSDPRREEVETRTNECILYLDLYSSRLENNFKGLSVSNTACYYYLNGCYAYNSSLDEAVTFINDNEILSINYYISDEIISDYSLIQDTFINGSKLRINMTTTGWKYVTFKILDEAGITNYFQYGFLFDFDAPVISETNFNNYNKDKYYNSFELTVSYNETPFDNSNVKIYYYISDSLTNVNKEMILTANNLYNSSVIIDSSYSDNSYKVCFISADPVGNYSEITCKTNLNLDTTPLKKEEVEIESDNDNDNTYKKGINIKISIEGVGNEEIKCGLIEESSTISSYSELTSKCVLNENNYLTVENENKYYLWIYAFDRANNYSLLKLDESYLIDGLAPRVSYTINGDNSSYNNSVFLDVIVNDISEVNLLSYSFYFNTYNENEFKEINEDKKITYPLSYYGIYKLAIKACDILGNCKINTYSDTFYIDTSDIEIKLIGKEKVKIYRWGRYKEQGASASKGSGKYLTSIDYIIEGEIDTSKVGSYYLTYISGEGINRISVVREIEVVESSYLLIVLFSLLVMGETIILLRIFIKKKKNDSI